MASPQPSPSRIGKYTAMGHRYLSRWVSWSGNLTPTPPGSPSRPHPSEGLSLSPQPPRAFQPRSRTSSKASNVSEKTPVMYPLVPKLPVPPLGHTLTWYLTHMRPVLKAEEYKETAKVVEEFGRPGGVGEKVQEELIKRHDTTDNWAYDWWLDDMYMNIALPLPVNSNPGMVFPHQKFASDVDMTQFAARLVSASLDMKERIAAGDLDVDRCTARERHQPLCMAQYTRVFSSYRRPAIPKDKLLSTADQQKENQHIIAIYKNHMFKVEVVVEGTRLSQQQVMTQLREVLRQVDEYEGSDPPPVGVMTSDNRRTWAQSRQILAGEPDNKRILGIIEACVLVVCFDDPLPTKFNLATRTSHRASLSKRSSSLNMTSSQNSSQEQDGTARDEVNAGHQMIHGGGFNHNSANRWFDKTVQFVLTRDGWSGLCYEHSCAEGIVVIQIVEQILQCIASENQKDDMVESLKQTDTPRQGSQDLGAQALGMEGDIGFPAPEETAPTPTRLEWKVTPVIYRRIQESADHVDRLVEDLDFRILRYLSYGRNYIKRSKCSPDAFIQLALQLAFFRCHGQLTSTYESASTRRFRHGRVDSIRANTPQVLAWCEAMVINAPIADRLAKYEAAIKLQTDIMVNNILGRGIDIHLLGLREMAKEMGLPTPEIFAHDSYRIANHFRLSTSQVPTLSDSWMGYGPVVPDGYGASYNPHPDYIVFCLSAFKSCEETSTLEFGRNLERALDEMKVLLENRSV
ncbi:choline O-acetyltransferase-like [Eriocheir sinensis]|uniref:choline O-acetyltransferase-like n=1 Tax=Eriocheir sinensis TaxID=95602 RepID=UPI0021C6837C|nr:choline O-acetyltransferase-like [Eriocheir sinensis]XP_050719793.1 choline O-acetyltransferase-like [Eriocheir sinensis]